MADQANPNRILSDEETNLLVACIRAATSPQGLEIDYSLLAAATGKKERALHQSVLRLKRKAGVQIFGARQKKKGKGKANANAEEKEVREEEDGDGGDSDGPPTNTKKPRLDDDDDEDDKMANGGNIGAAAPAATTTVAATP